MEPLFFIIDQFSKLEHTLVPSDINPKDRQNFKSCTKISSDEILNILEQVPIPNSIGISIYLKASKRKGFIVNESELDHTCKKQKVVSTRAFNLYVFNISHHTACSQGQRS